jgi:hypothetical protein
VSSLQARRPAAVSVGTVIMALRLRRGAEDRETVSAASNAADSQ